MTCNLPWRLGEIERDWGVELEGNRLCHRANLKKTTQGNDRECGVRNWRMKEARGFCFRFGIFFFAFLSAQLTFWELNFGGVFVL